MLQSNKVIKQNWTDGNLCIENSTNKQWTWKETQPTYIYSSQQAKTNYKKEALKDLSLRDDIIITKAAEQ